MAETIGRYEIISEIGRGGMATVYLALDPRFRRQVAIKVLPRQFTHDPRFLSRFEHEAQTIAALEHPAIVPVYDFGEHDDAPYLVMRYMAGGSLRDRLHGRPLNLAETARIFNAIALALDLAHARGIIHRDLKPANVLFDESDDPFLADFGIARLAEATHTMTVVGTPAYMSPEQAQGREKLDGRSDIYALGVMLYELLTGKQPYEADTPTGQMLMHILEPVPDILEANPALSQEAQVIVGISMAKDRDDRYGTAGELATAVRALAAGEMSGIGEAVIPTTAADAGAPVVPAEQSTKLEEQMAATAGSGAAQTVLDAPFDLRDENDAADPSHPDEGGTVPPAESDRAWGDLPGWVWWTGALALLAIVVLGLRAVFTNLDESDPTVVPEVPTVSVEVEEMATATNTPAPTKTPTRVPSPTPLATPILLPENATLGDTWLRPVDGMTMVYVPAGIIPSYVVVSGDNEDLVPERALNAFWLDRTEVTNAQFAEFVDDTGYETTAENQGSGDVFTDESVMGEGTEGADWQHPQGPSSNLSGLDDHPVVQVSWDDADAYCTWAGARLPLDLEWGYAERGPDWLVFPWGNEMDGEKANFCDSSCSFDIADKDINDGFELTAPVGSYAAGASWAGALDMAGNVAEWTHYFNHEDYDADLLSKNLQVFANDGFNGVNVGSWGLPASFFEFGTALEIDFYSGRNDNTGFRCVVSSGSTGAFSEELPSAKVSSGVGVYLRGNPGTDSVELEYLPDGTSLFLLEGKQTAGDLEWRQVQTDTGQVGWVVSDFITTDSP